MSKGYAPLISKKGILNGKKKKGTAALLLVIRCKFVQ